MTGHLGNVKKMVPNNTGLIKEKNASPLFYLYLICELEKWDYFTNPLVVVGVCSVYLNISFYAF